MSRGKPNKATLVHGERSKYVKRDLLPAVVAELAEIEAKPIQPIRVNLAERRVRRSQMPRDAPEDVIAVLDEADRRDVALDLKSRELEASREDAAAPLSIVLSPITIVSIPCRGGNRRAFAHPDDPAIYLVESGGGAWLPHRSTTRDGIEVFEPVLSLSEGEKNP